MNFAFVEAIEAVVDDEGAQKGLGINKLHREYEVRR